MLKNIKAVLFDLDGTLIDSMWMWENIDIEFLAQRNIEMPKTLQVDIEGMSFSETAEYFKERFSLKESVEELKEIWNQMALDKYLHEVSYKKGAQQFLDYLKEQKIKMGIATSNSKELVNAVGSVYDFDNYFDCILTACEVAHGKPAPDIYLKAAELLEVPKEECLVFEDVPMGILAGKNAGMKVCAVEDTFSADQIDKKRKYADYYIQSFDDIFSNDFEVL